jgi:hypothetical protein
LAIISGWEEVPRGDIEKKQLIKAGWSQTVGKKKKVHTGS